MYFEDKHILSFIFRTQVIYGYFYFSKIFKKMEKQKVNFTSRKNSYIHIIFTMKERFMNS